jgi:hypothetical protein
MNNKLKSELKNGDIYTFRVKRNKVRQVKQIKKTYRIQEDCWKLIKEFMIDYTHKRLHYKNDYNYDIEDQDDIIKKQHNIPNYVLLLWNYNNNKLDNIIENDIRYNPEHKQNLMWIETIKQKNNWKKGEEIYLSFKCNCDGACYVWGYKRQQGYDTDMMIDSNGVVNKVRFEMSQEVDCMYNDLLKLSLVRQNVIN